MAFIDYYKLLELDKSASQADIKKAYRKLARKYHPDLNPNDKEAQLRFQQINEANEVLSDPEKRKKYDQYGKDWQHADAYEEARKQQQASGGRAYSGGGFGGSGFGGGQAGGYSYSGNFDDDTFSDFFEEMFGSSARAQGSGRGRHYKGQDFNAELQLNLSDVYTSHKQTLTVNGKNIRLTIPAGVENGQTIKIKGHGGPGVQGGPKGDLFITFNIVNNTKFKREKENLFTTIEIDFYTALLGGEITVDTFSGKVKLNVNPETQPGTKVKLKGKGFPKYKKEGQFGDLIITYNIKIPTNLSNREKELFKELQKLRS
ncbi:molecular chaperone DnaJ [Salegentibacter salinarum]|uniref:Molecular chaperone DnaJ n=1 Tax=Salegentibacter salinarum TaxID=447422 RepID=A0A2N0U324_9FLAO|nr:J domain-containing protein [Salegentibacter salinarum]PKD21412.1 molecular chaperone DnaJ [Salegentibacter salinarum]SKB39072.1 curved DNA-binding protein [Salegentibacter salinarum]